jgi:hypothetical protein
MYTNAAPKKSYRLQENNDTSSSSNPFSYISPLDTELQHKTESSHRGNTDSCQEEKHYEQPEPFDFTNYIQATAPSSPTLYHDNNNNLNHSNEIPFTFGSTSDDPNSRKDPVATPFPTPVTKPKPLDSAEPHTSHTIQTYQSKNTIPFVSMDHDRRKRRRMTMEDSFANFLSMNRHDDNTTSTTNSLSSATSSSKHSNGLSYIRNRGLMFD